VRIYSTTAGTRSVIDTGFEQDENAGTKQIEGDEDNFEVHQTCRHVWVSRFSSGVQFLGVEDGREAVSGRCGAKLHEDSQFYRVSFEGHREDVSDEIFVVPEGGGIFDGAVQED